ncbi:PREDICTED: uncharacterized protein LOC105132460 [Populus euphratica]|uniref:Uncharacterized protein LOC105132460 n=1 Tax=Populus euphratica TaxID=75702 RepID=A0AAJ6UQZ1_POPEU|nr:PREDICTED: uncharacterized protein LOC105132460 [Populus euphratica]
MGSSSPSPSLLLLFSLVFASSLFLSRATHETTLKGIDAENPAVDVTLSHDGSKDAFSCERVKVSGHLRWKLSRYASSFRVTLAPSAPIPERLHSNIQVCFHRNASLGLCQCKEDDWRIVQNGLWTSVMSPYEERYVDVKFIGHTSGSVSIAVDEDLQQWRLMCLAVGFVLLLLAPIVSSWVPFYYSTSMAIGVFLVIIILLFQGMKLLPTGRKNFFYLSIYGSVLGAGTFILHQISTLVNSILVNFGLTEDMHNPVYIFILVGIVLTGAGLGFWMVRKFVISKDGNVDDGVAQFVKWAMRIIASTFILQSTLDTPLALGALLSSCAICSVTLKWWYQRDQSDSGGGSAWLQPAGQTTARFRRAEFLSRSGKMSPQGKMWNSPESSSAWTRSPVKGVVSPSSHLATVDKQDYYSTFHKNLKRKFTKKQWEDFTRESTHEAVMEWAASPEVTNWIINNADRIQLLPSNYGSEEMVGSESDSTDASVAGSGKPFSLLNW